MSRIPFFIAAALLLGVILLSHWENASAEEKAKEKPATARVKWEYKVIPIRITGTEKALNDLGQDGWELVAVMPGDKGFAAQAFFKRPLAEPAKKEAAAPK